MADRKKGAGGREQGEGCKVQESVFRYRVQSDTNLSLHSMKFQRVRTILRKFFFYVMLYILLHPNLM